MSKYSLIFTNIKKIFASGDTLFENISGVFHQGSSYAITGMSGSGKTTLLHMLAGIESPTAGAIELVDAHGKQLYKNSRIYSDVFGLVFQRPYLIKELTVLENIMLKGLIAGNTLQDCTKEAYYLLDLIGLSCKAHAKPIELSGGQQQRVAVARALFGKPCFLLADEPTGNLDMFTGQSIISIITHYQQQYSMGLIITSHTPYVIEQMEHRYHVENGNLFSIAGSYMPDTLLQYNHTISGKENHAR